MPASITATRSPSPRSRTWSTDATIQPAAATRNRPGSTASRAGRRSGGTASSRARASSAKRAGAGTVPGSPDREATADVERVEPGAPGPDEREHREPASDGIAPCVDRPELRAHVQVDAAGPQRAVPGKSRQRGRQLGLGHPELGGPATNGEPVVGLGLDVGVEAQQHVQRRAAAGPEPGPAGDGGQRVELLRALDRDPAQRVAGGRGADGRAKVRVGLADPLERHPRVRDAGGAGDRPLAARHDVRAEPEGPQAGDHRRHVVRLERERAQPRVRERGFQLRRGRAERGDRGDVDRRAEPPRGRDEGPVRRRRAGDGVSRGSRAPRRWTRR